MSIRAVLEFNDAEYHGELEPVQKGGRAIQRGGNAALNNAYEQLARAQMNVYDKTYEIHTANEEKQFLTTLQEYYKKINDALQFNKTINAKIAKTVENLNAEADAKQSDTEITTLNNTKIELEAALRKNTERINNIKDMIDLMNVVEENKNKELGALEIELKTANKAVRDIPATDEERLQANKAFGNVALDQANDLEKKYDEKLQNVVKNLDENATAMNVETYENIELLKKVSNVTPAMNQIIQNLLREFNTNVKRHIEVIDKIKQTIKDLAADAKQTVDKIGNNSTFNPIVAMASVPLPQVTTAVFMPPSPPPTERIDASIAANAVTPALLPPPPLVAQLASEVNTGTPLTTANNSGNVQKFINKLKSSRQTKTSNPTWKQINTGDEVISALQKNNVDAQENGIDTPQPIVGTATNASITAIDKNKSAKKINVTVTIKKGEYYGELMRVEPSGTNAANQDTRKNWSKIKDFAANKTKKIYNTFQRNKPNSYFPVDADLNNINGGKSRNKRMRPRRRATYKNKNKNKNKNLKSTK